LEISSKTGSHNLSEEERRKQSIEKALAETERARTQAQEGARRFREVEAGRPFGPLPSQAPERIKHQKIRPETLQGAPQPLPKPPRTIIRTRTVQAPQKRQRSRRGTFGFSFRPKKAGGRPPNLPDSPANIDPEEKTRAIERLNLAIARENRKYATEIVHGGSDVRKDQTRKKIQQLENEKRAVQNMKPTGKFRYDLFHGLRRFGGLPGHVREAEKG
jgi:acyl transferase domain-containing protein